MNKLDIDDSLNEFYHLELPDNKHIKLETIYKVREILILIENYEKISFREIDIFNLSPGYNAEISIDIRNNSKSIEILIYEDKEVIVFFEENNNKQESFSKEKLNQYLNWLYE